jgi:transcription elongation factor GreA
MVNYVTKKGFKELQEQAHILKNVEIKNALEMLSDARDKGDLSENAEYDAAKELHQNLTNKLALLNKKIDNSVIITSNMIFDDKVSMLSYVEIKNHNTNKIQEIQLVPENEIDIKNGKISFNSPIGKSLIGKKIGDIVECTTPAGKMKLEILKMRNDNI